MVAVVSVGDQVWIDTDRDGLQSAGEPGVEGVTVNLYDSSGAVVATTTTDEEGFYSFTDLLAGADYTIEFVKPADWSFTTPNAGSDPGLDSDADVVTGRVAITAPLSGTNSATMPDDPSIDAGFVRYNLTLAKVLETSGDITVGDEVTFKLTPRNDGPSTALAGWSVTEVLPAGLTFVSMSGTGYDCTGTTCVASEALSGGTDGPVITVVATVSGKKDLRNVAYVDKSPEDVDETVPLGPVPTPGTDTDETATDNDAQVSVVLKVPDLARTGFEAGPWLLSGAGLLILGAILLLVARLRGPRRRDYSDGSSPA
ncbi:MAG: hypothetical protein CSA84_02905 [Actinomycetales bacterium]|nr:MAG: hypothetical protein CSA84_02905 [Actinomycetales bacterium]